MVLTSELKIKMQCGGLLLRHKEKRNNSPCARQDKQQGAPRTGAKAPPSALSGGVASPLQPGKPMGHMIVTFNFLEDWKIIFQMTSLHFFKYLNKIDLF